MLQPESVRTGSNRNIDQLVGVAERSRSYTLETKELPIRRMLISKPYIIS